MDAEFATSPLGQPALFDAALPPACPHRAASVSTLAHPLNTASNSVPPNLQFPTVVAWSQVIRVEQPNQPMQGHLSLTGVPG